MKNEMNKSVDKFLEGSVSYLARISVDSLTDGEFKSLMELFKSGEMIETSKGYVWGFDSGITNFSKKKNAFFVDIDVEDYAHLPVVLQELLAKANVRSKIRIPGYACDFSMKSWHEFADGKLVCCESRNFYDNGIREGGKPAFIATCAEKFGVDLDSITYDDPEVFAAFQNQDIMKWSFVYSCDDPENDAMAILKPRSMDDLMVYFAFALNEDNRKNLDIIKEYVARRDGLKPVPQNLPDGLKKSFGIAFFYEQEKLLESSEWRLPQLMPILAAKLKSEDTYKFAYLCVKHGAHKELG